MAPKAPYAATLLTDVSASPPTARRVAGPAPARRAGGLAAGLAAGEPALSPCSTPTTPS